MKRRPWKVPVALTQYAVRYVRGLKAPDGERVAGLTQFDRRLISIEANQSDDAQTLTFWHEYMHAMAHENGYTRLCDDEAQIEAFAQNIARSVRAVPKRHK